MVGADGDGLGFDALGGDVPRVGGVAAAGLVVATVVEVAGRPVGV
jgi:hypothetical protein